jgi:hypothetical protein
LNYEKLFFFLINKKKMNSGTFQADQQQHKQNETITTTTTTEYHQGKKDQNGSESVGTQGQGPQSHAGLPTVNNTIPMTSDMKTAEIMTNDSADKL